MKKLLLFLFLGIILFDIVSSIELRASPAELKFNSNGEKVCDRVKVYYSGIVDLEDKWAKKGVVSGNLVEHSFSAEELGLKVSYEKKVYVEKNKEVEICIFGKQGEYHGILLIHAENTLAGIGVWLDVSVKGEEIAEINKITGAAVGEGKKVHFPLLISSIILLIIFLFLLLKLRKR